MVIAPAHLERVMESVTVTNTVKMSGSVVGITTTTLTRAVTQAIQYLLLISVITLQTVLLVMMRATARKKLVSVNDLLQVLTNWLTIADAYRGYGVITNWITLTVQIPD